MDNHVFDKIIIYIEKAGERDLFLDNLERFYENGELHLLLDMTINLLNIIDFEKEIKKRISYDIAYDFFLEFFLHLSHYLNVSYTPEMFLILQSMIHKIILLLKNNLLAENLDANRRSSHYFLFHK